MKTLLQKYWLLFILLATSLTTQIIYWQAKPELGNCYDCGEYQDLANFISRNPKNVISDFRPPLYPILMILVGLATPSQTGDRNLFTAQSLILMATIVILWLVTVKMKIPPYLSFLTLLTIIVNPAFFSFTKFKLTETLNLFFLTLLILASLTLKNKLSVKSVLVFVAVAGLLVFTRFANSYLVFVIFILVGIHLRRELTSQKRLLLIWLFGLLLLLAPQVLYSFANKHRNYYFGLTGETGTNLLGKLVQYRLIPKTDPDYQKIIDATLGCKGTLATTDVFTCVWNFLPKNSFVSKYSVDNMYVDNFDKKYILGNLPTYLIKSAPIAFVALARPASEYLILSQTGHALFDIEIKIANILYKGLVLWLITILPLYVLLNIKRMLNLQLFPFTAVLIISFYYVAITALAAINDYQRIATPAALFLFLIAPYTTCKVLKTFRLPKIKVTK